MTGATGNDTCNFNIKLNVVENPVLAQNNLSALLPTAIL
jgi:hypothetical protein